MMDRSTPYIPFSQRSGVAPIPPQLKLGEVSKELRRLLHYAISLEIQREARSGFNYAFLEGRWYRVATDFHVRFLEKSFSSFENKAHKISEEINEIVERAPVSVLFDLVEFFIRHAGCGAELKGALAGAFVDSRAAYRVFDNQYIAAIGTDEQATAFEHALARAEGQNATGARRQLISAGIALRSGDWAGSVRESIHAVESVAVRLAPAENTLGAALKVLETQGHLHGALRAAFDKLYGYTSDEEGVRHALVFEDEAQVDEADALFMLGACASFISYLLSRSAALEPR